MTLDFQRRADTVHRDEQESQRPLIPSAAVQPIPGYQALQVAGRQNHPRFTRAGAVGEAARQEQDLAPVAFPPRPNQPRGIQQVVVNHVVEHDCALSRRPETPGAFGNLRADGLGQSGGQAARQRRG